MTPSLSTRGFALCVVGVPGVGKSRLLEQYASTRLDSARHVVGSSIVKRIIAPDTVRDLDAYSAERQEAVRTQAIRELEGRRAEFSGVLLVDGHVTLRNRVSRTIEVVFTRADERFYDAIVLLDGDPAHVFAQRMRDERVREPEGIESIALHVDVERELARQVARRMSVPFLEINVSDLDAREAQLHSIVEGLRMREAGE